MHTINLFTIVSLILLPFFPSSNCYFNLIPLKSSSGLLFEKVGESIIPSGRYTLLHYCNFTVIMEQIVSARNVYNKLSTTCQRITQLNEEANKKLEKMSSTKCQNSIDILATRLEVIDEGLRILTRGGHNSRRRTKSGMMNFLGIGLRWLTGTPDADDSSYFYDSIKALQANEKLPDVVLKQQVKILSSAIDGFSKSSERIDKSISTINRDISIFQSYIENSQANQLLTEYELDFTETAAALTNIIGIIHDTLWVFLNTIPHLPHKIDHRLLSSVTLMHELELIQSKHPLPLPITSANIESYYRMIEPSAFIKDDVLVIAFDVPLAGNDTYDIFEMFPLPTPHPSQPGLFSYIHDHKDQPYLLVSHSKTSYAKLKTLEPECKEFAPSRWLCNSLVPTRRSSDDGCEVQLFFDSTTAIPNSCIVKHGFGDIELWHPLGHDQWLYTITKRTALSITCGEKKDNVLVMGQGILSLSDDCRAATPISSIVPHVSVGKHSYWYKLPAIDLLAHECCDGLHRNITIESSRLKRLHLSALNLKELKGARDELTQMEGILQKKITEPFIVRHYDWLLLSGATIGGIVALTAVLVLCKCTGLYKCLIMMIWPSSFSWTKLCLCCLPGNHSNDTPNVQYEGRASHVTIQHSTRDRRKANRGTKTPNVYKTSQLSLSTVMSSSTETERETHRLKKKRRPASEGTSYSE